MSFYALYHDEAAPGAAGIGSMAASTSPEKKTPETHVPRATLEATAWQTFEVLDAMRAAVFDEEMRPSILSVSYGWPEPLWTPSALDILNDLFAAAALVGVTVMCSSGDHGAELQLDGKPHVVAPASVPFAHAAGATQVQAGDDEVAWAQTGGPESHYPARPQ